MVEGFCSTWPHSIFLCDALDGLTGLTSHIWPHLLFNPSYSYEEISNMVGEKKINAQIEYLKILFLLSGTIGFFFFWVKTN